jgi:oxygen-independent coproporphyrinogen-3 oxidase
MSTDIAQGLYIHLPFCLRKCHYCDFTIRVLNRPQQIERYLSHIQQEIQALSHLPHQLKTVYIGGGTPSLLNSEQLARLCSSLKKHFDFKHLSEWTFEVNPEQQSTDYFEQCLTAGITRISLGAQSFVPTELAVCGRHHRATDIQVCVENLRKSGFKHINIDLIYGLPGQTPESWRFSLESALELNPTHLSLYSLEIQPQTQFGYQEKHAPLSRPSEEDEVTLYHTACEILQKSGFEHYEIANWAPSGYESQHNLCYWRTESVLAAGVGAHGYWNNIRYANPDNLLNYYAQCEAQAWAWEQTESQSRQEAAAERLILGLRLLKEGLDGTRFAQDFGLSPEQACPEMLTLEKEGQLLRCADHWYLNPEYIMVSNSIFAQLLEPRLPSGASP